MRENEECLFITAVFVYSLQKIPRQMKDQFP